jgi:hypothetical protein
VGELFPLSLQELKISLSLADDSSLCPSFLKSNESASDISAASSIVAFDALHLDAVEAPQAPVLVAVSSLRDPPQGSSPRQFPPKAQVLNSPSGRVAVLSQREVNPALAVAAGVYSPSQSVPIASPAKSMLGTTSTHSSEPTIAPLPKSFSLPSYTSRAGRKSRFSPEEDGRLQELVRQYGEGCWSRIAAEMPGRNRKQVCERYKNFLKKERALQDFTVAEDMLIIKYVHIHGRQWNIISEQLPGRTPIMIKNRYYARLQELCKPRPFVAAIPHPKAEQNHLIKPAGEATLPEPEAKKEPEDNLVASILKEDAKCLLSPVGRSESPLKQLDKPTQELSQAFNMDADILKRQASQMRVALKSLNEEIRKLQARLRT